MRFLPPDKNRIKDSLMSFFNNYLLTLVFNKSRKCLWINLGGEKVRFSGGKAPQKKLEKRKSE